MAQPTSGDRREDQAAIAGSAVAAIFAAIEAAILAAVADLTRRAVLGMLLPAVAARRLARQITVIFDQAQPEIRAVLRQSARDASASAAEVIRADLEYLPRDMTDRIVRQVTESRLPSMPDLQGSLEAAGRTASRVAQEAFMRAVTAEPERQSVPESLLRAGLNPFRTEADEYQRAVQEAMRYRSGIGEAVRDLTGAERRAQSLSRLQTAQKVIDDLAARGITGFTDASGRSWEMASYAEMATRTASSRLHLQLQLAAMGPAGMDLVIVDNPGRVAPCPRCRPWEGKVLSLTGRTDGENTITDAGGQKRTEKIAGTLAEATTAGLLHPACRHSLIPWVSGAAFLPTVGGQERGYVEHGQPVSSALPIGTLQDYKDEQKLRGMERSVRAARRGRLTAMTPQAKRDARRDVDHAVSVLERHVSTTNVLRQKRREKLGAR